MMTGLLRSFASVALCVAVELVAGCKKPPPSGSPPLPRPPVLVGPTSTPRLAALADAGVAVTSSTPKGAASPPSALPPGCAAVRGPLGIPFVGAYTLVPGGKGVVVAGNDNGSAKLAQSSTLGTSPPSERTSLRPRGLACAHDGSSFYCADSSGRIHKSGAEGGDGGGVAESRPGTRIAASRTPAGEPVLAYIAEGGGGDASLHAWARVGAGPAERISDEGGGATDIALVTDRAGLVAVTIDGRAGLTPLHTRRWVLGGGFAGSPDEVVFVAGPGERLTRITAFANREGGAFATLAISKSVSEFGELVVPLDKAGGATARAVWSLYPNGLDPAPIAAATTEAGVVVARVRPATATSAVRMLELGGVDGAGEVTVRGSISTRGGVGDIALAKGERETFWLAFSDDAGGWLMQLQCGPLSQIGKSAL